MADKKLTPQERAEKFAAEYVKLCEKWQCKYVSTPINTAEGLVIAHLQVQVNDG